MLVTYENRLSAFKKRRVWRVQEDGLYWTEENGAEGSVSYLEISSMRLRYEPSQLDGKRVTVTVFSAKEKLIIASSDFVKMATLEDHSEEFGVFARALHETASKANPNIQYRAGNTGAGRAAMIGVLVLGIVALVVLGIFLLMQGMTFYFAIKFLVLIALFPLLFRMLKVNKPRPYDPLDLPDEIMNS